MGYWLSKVSESNKSPRRLRFSTLVLFLVSANLPDIDFIPGLILGDPFRYHRASAHSVGFALLVSALLYGVLKSMGRKTAVPAFFVCLAGVMSHLILDSVFFTTINFPFLD